MSIAFAADNDARDAWEYYFISATRTVAIVVSILSDDRAYSSRHGKYTDDFAPGKSLRDE